MRATHWLIGCVVCIAGLGGATAASLDSRDLNPSAHAATHAAMDNASAHEGSVSSGGDVLGLSRGDSAPGNPGDSDSSGSNSAHSIEHRGSTAPTPAPTRRPHLGWQSLLPGSIQ